MQEAAAPSQQSLLALCWLNFFLSGMQAAFGPIAAAYLAAREWSAKDIGFVLTIGGIASLVSQVPGGALLDAVRAKRLLVATCVVAVALSALIFPLWPSFSLVAFAEVLQGITGGILGRRLLLLPSDWSATPGWRNRSDRTSALRPLGVSQLLCPWRSSRIRNPPGQCSSLSCSPSRCSSR